MYEMFATFLLTILVLKIKNSGVLLRKLNQSEIMKARNFAMKRHLAKTRLQMNSKPKEQMMMELVDDDVAIETRQRTETKTIVNKLTRYELLM